MASTLRRFLAVCLLLGGGFSVSVQAAPPDRSLRGNPDIPKRRLALELPRGMWTELRNQEYDIHFQLAADVDPDGSIQIRTFETHDPGHISKQMAEMLSTDVRLYMPNRGNRARREADVHIMVYRQSSHGPLAIIFARVKNPSPASVTNAAPYFIQVYNLAPPEQ